MVDLKKVKLSCVAHEVPLQYEKTDNSYVGQCGCRYPVDGGVARFVLNEDYTQSFGLQWNTFRTTQLDSHSGTHISENRLTRILGGDLDIVRGKNVLEAGCGAGRFTEILLKAGAHVYAVDLSSAVEANYKNCSGNEKYFVCQADINRLPFAKGQFDIVICVGVIQHTKSTEDTIAKLAEQVRPGGLLAIDHYTYGYPIGLTQRLLRGILLKIRKEKALETCRMMVDILWPIHKLAYKLRNMPLFFIIKTILQRMSPIVDYHYVYPELGAEKLKIWALLDTHDTLTDYYKHLRSAEEIEECLVKNGMSEVKTRYAGNGVEALAMKKGLV